MMVDRVFCVDFGSAYTKVALRRDPQARGALVACSDTAIELWAPTVVAADWSKGEARLDFGYKAAGIKPGGKITVYTDFKKNLFSTAVDTSSPPPLDALLQSEEFETLAAKYSVLPPQLAALRMMAGAARALVGGTADRTGSAEGRKQEEAKRLAYHYFKWLRERVLDACNRLPDSALRYEDIPLRVAVPVLGEGDLAQHPGCQRLREALNSTGWKLDDRLFVSEPESNAVGILTQASNLLTKKQKINLGEMFGKGPLITVIKGDVHHPTYRALVIDVGAFTTDFAALTIDTGGTQFDTSNGAGFGIVQHSVRLGMTTLDASVRGGFSVEKQGMLDALSRKEFEEFQFSAYTEGIGYRLPGTRVAIGGESDRVAVQTAMADFTNRLTDETTKFCAALEPASMQELILTGGGSSIPAVRDAVIAAAQTDGKPFVKTHAPDLKRGKAGSPLVDKLDTQFTRGGSALGGASIYFERGYY